MSEVPAASCPVRECAKDLADNEIRFKWLDDSMPDAKYWRGFLKGVITWRNEVVEMVAAETGANVHVLELDEQIAERRRELRACCLDADDDQHLADLTALRKVAGKLAVLKIIDHPTIVWVLEAKRKKVGEVRELFRQPKKLDAPNPPPTS